MTPRTLTSSLFAAVLIVAPLFAQDAPANRGGVPAARSGQPKTVEIKSLDGLQIRADLYAPHTDEKTPFIVLFHQAGWSRGEYRTTAPRLNRMGFNCLAIDQRSGGTVNDVPNETHNRAKKADKTTSYLDARQDLVAALRYARNHLAKGRLIAWGSSYSAALVLQVVGSEKNIADGVLSFSPGEYFTRLGKPEDWVTTSAKTLNIPVFITSARHEKRAWVGIFKAIPSKRKASFLPKTRGNHGSRALWKRFADSGAYWKAVTGFLDANFPRIEKPTARGKTHRQPAEGGGKHKRPRPGNFVRNLR